MRLFPTLLLSAAGATMIAALPAQETPTTPRAERAQSPAADEVRSDGILATWLLVGNQNEIALAELAAQRATDPEVKQFAQKMLDDHRQLGVKLQPFATAVGYSPLATTGRAVGEGREAGTERTVPNVPREAGAGRTEHDGLDHVALLQELGQQCLSSAKKELEAKQGADFDRCFMGMAVGGHAKTVDMMTVFQRHASDSLGSVIRAGQPTVTAHLEHAKTLFKKLEGK